MKLFKATIEAPPRIVKSPVTAYVLAESYADAERAVSYPQSSITKLEQIAAVDNHRVRLVDAMPAEAKKQHLHTHIDGVSQGELPPGFSDAQTAGEAQQ